MKGISQFPTLLESFFMDRLMRQRQASPHTIASYRDTFRLLMQYAQQRFTQGTFTGDHAGFGYSVPRRLSRSP